MPQAINSPSLEAVADHVSTSLFNSLKRGFAEIIPKTAAVEDMKCMERLFIAFDLSASEHADFKAAFSEVFAVGSRLSPRVDLPSFALYALRFGKLGSLSLMAARKTQALPGACV
ncbi:hypothetical protein [Delftia acidovorans]|uniref:hypothetical protein n=1 Tax=Delftia acidovorans TaxID=80866 RepID=UPI00192C8B89|nr:hypothetical protein [Delftia acidovorans]